MADRPGRGRGRGLRASFKAKKPGGDSETLASATASTTTTGRAGDSSGSESTAVSGNVAPSSVSTIQLGADWKSLQVGGSTGTTTESLDDDDTLDTLDSDESFAKRPGAGTIGRPIQLRTNNFEVIIDSGFTISQYRIDITSELRQLKRDECYAIFWQTAVNLKWFELNDPYTVLYDGGNICFSLNPLNVHKDFDQLVEAMLPRYNRPGKYRFIVKPTGRKVINFGGGKHKQLALSILDMAYRQFYNMPALLNQQPALQQKAKLFTSFGRSFFTSPNQGVDRCGFDLNAGRQVWAGYFLAMKLGPNLRPIVNIDVANSVFIKKQTVLEFMCEVLNEAMNCNQYTLGQMEALRGPFQLKTHEHAAFEKAIKGLSVLTRNAPNRPQKIISVQHLSAEQLKFESKHGGQMREMTVAEYFASKNQPLKFPFFPCLESGNKKKPSFLPLEVCEMFTPHRVSGKLSDIQTSMMIKGVCTDAPERERRIMDVIGKASLNQDPFAKRFGFKIDLKMMQLTGRVIPAPSLEYTNYQKIAPREGSWMMNQGAKFFISGQILSYGVVTLLGRHCENDLAEFCRELMRLASASGMVVGSINPASVVYVDGRNQNQAGIHKGLETCRNECMVKDNRCDLLIVPVPSRDTQKYSVIKSVCEKQLGVSSQVVLQRNIRGAKRQTLENILLKINGKLGGVNCKLSTEDACKKYLLGQPTLVLGIDVTHPSPGDSKAPSIGAAVGNIDIFPGKFAASIMVQKHRREAVVYLTDAIQRRVEAFYTHTQRKPERILVFRDGVAEGQFEEVMTEEVKNIRKACATLGGESFKPKITFVVVQKRHHSRFFCVNYQDGSGRAKNVPPGTVVDSVVTHPVQFDYFLCSHFGIQGTSRPAHYHVLMDENGFTPDELQAISYGLCHIYFRCNRSVSIPAPTYYAHLACARARSHMHSIIENTSDTMSEAGSSSGSSSGSTESEEELRRAVEVTESMMNKMYFL